MKKPKNQTAAVLIGDFVAYLPQHTYIFLPTREPWPGSSVDSQFPMGVALLDAAGNPMLGKNGKPIRIAASEWLDINRPVQQMTWAPGLPMLIRDRLVADGGWIDRPNATCLNLYRPPKIELGDARKAKPWLDHVRKVYPTDASHIIFWLAHRVQHSADKLNHAVLLGGAQGIGKDTLLEPVKHAVGPWNFAEVSPTQMLGRFNGYLRSVILRVSEARDLGESNRFVAYDHMKTYTAAPPDTLRVDEKHLREYYILNCCGVVITSNYKTEGIYLPADDRRHYVAWSDLTKEEFTAAYWKKLWRWYDNGGRENVTAYLSKLDISAFDPKAPPPKTAAFWAIVDANRAPEEGELADIIEKLGNPDAVTLEQISDGASMGDGGFKTWLEDRKNRRVIPHRMEVVGYTPVRNRDADSGLWRIDKIKTSYVTADGPVESVRQVVYAKSTLSLQEQLAAVEALRREAVKAGKAAKEKAEAAEAERAKRAKGNGSKRPRHY